jgi:hypothetical protein
MSFKFSVEDKDGNPAKDMEPYMGMAGHAEFGSTDMRTSRPCFSSSALLTSKKQSEAENHHEENVQIRCSVGD